MIKLEDIRLMSDGDLYKLSLECDENGVYTYNADCAYRERRRRSKIIHYANVSNKCSKYQADIDYYGCVEVGNR